MDTQNGIFDRGKLLIIVISCLDFFTRQGDTKPQDRVMSVHSIERILEAKGILDLKLIDHSDLTVGNHH